MADGASSQDDWQALRRGWAAQWRVLQAMVMREILTRYGRHNIGFLWLFFEPMIFTLGVTALWTATKSVHGSNLPIVPFALTGYSCVLLWRNMPGRCIGAILPNSSLLFHRQVKIIDIFLSRVTLEAAGATMSFAGLGLVFWAIGWTLPPEDMLKLLGGWLLLIWFGAALAVYLGALAERTEVVDKIWHPLSYLLFPLSGASFIVDALPKQAQDIVLYLPMLNAAELIREGYFGTAFTAHYSISYTVLFNLVLSLLALIELRRAERHLVPE